MADVCRYLKPNHISACVKLVKGNLSRKTYLNILISLTIHPGGVIIVNAIGSPPQHSKCPFANEPLCPTRRSLVLTGTVPETVKPYYPSSSVIGRLFRDIELPLKAKPNSRQPRSRRKTKRDCTADDFFF